MLSSFHDRNSCDVQDRGLIIVDTPSPPDNPTPPHFDPASTPSLPLSDTSWTPPIPSTPLVFPTFFLYPQYDQSDLITHFHEDTLFSDHLAAMFPGTESAGAPWDEQRDYWTGNLAVYAVTRDERLLKVGKGLTLRDVVRKAYKEEGGRRDGVLLRDGLLSFTVLPKAYEQQWVDGFKRKRDKT